MSCGFRLRHFKANVTIGFSVGVALLIAGCGTVVIRKEITRQADGWTIVLQRLRDGPNSVGPVGNTVYHPEPGMRFIHAFLRFKNDDRQTRKFSYDACDLDLDDEFVVPAIVTRYNGLMSVIDKDESYPPADVSYRALAFSYPVGRFPKRLKCALMTFDIPQGPVAASH
ncbi:MAG TPA: hypothetical protein VNO55_21015 [Polyangia bacterium]|nr:hypothetical protein [Polyangia bacterium]